MKNNLELNIMTMKFLKKKKLKLNIYIMTMLMTNIS